MFDDEIKDDAYHLPALHRFPIVSHVGRVSDFLEKSFNM
jgi:hypothetical protein